MGEFKEWIAHILEVIASFSAESPSSGINYDPKVPDLLKKEEN